MVICISLKGNFQRHCKKCNAFFPAKPMELKFFCSDDCENKSYFSPNYLLEHFKHTRLINLYYFDLFDLNRPIYKREIEDYERVCRECGKPNLNKDGKYSPFRRYCLNHKGEKLFENYNWGLVSKNYAFDLQKQQKEEIFFIMDKIPREHQRYIILCELCGKPCLIYRRSRTKIDPINIHHKIPVHTLIWDNLTLIWDYSNLIALCPKCHNNQDHQLKRKSQYQYQNIMNFIKG